MLTLRFVLRSSAKPKTKPNHWVDSPSVAPPSQWPPRSCEPPTLQPRWRHVGTTWVVSGQRCFFHGIQTDETSEDAKMLVPKIHIICREWFGCVFSIPTFWGKGYLLSFIQGSFKVLHYSNRNGEGKRHLSKHRWPILGINWSTPDLSTNVQHALMVYYAYLLKTFLRRLWIARLY